ncbi:hypothetical protein [Actinomarinicola tropica]|uniref:Uncharacterized protein n=1 Tax=Actinomarinicola tropica TaxID=2789776 RepID=A0A5Q2RML3_9ACTN|nr:hypothetical protein [Actinomarinicola tropica]QGG95656.1 hypothetical protein GH723_11425 [Actinomarinicola tropica]
MAERAHRDRGSVLLLFPAAFLIVLVLGSIAIDAGVAFMRQRELATAASAAVNDGVALATADALERGDGVRIDHARLEAAVVASLDRRGVLATLTAPPQVRIVDSDLVEVTLVARADYVIAPALPGGRDGIDVRATATARLVVDDG